MTVLPTPLDGPRYAEAAAEVRAAWEADPDGTVSVATAAALVSTIEALRNLVGSLFEDQHLSDLFDVQSRTESQESSTA